MKRQSSPTRLRSARTLATLVALAGIAALACLVACSTAPSSSGGESAQSGDYTAVDAQFVSDNAQSMPLVDVRTAQEYADGHIPGALNIAYSEVMSNDYTQAAAMVDAYAQAGIAPDAEVIIYCRSGKRVKAVAKILADAGYNHIYLYEGSWNDWSSDPARPVE